jgi:hypothetical protein
MTARCDWCGARTAGYTGLCRGCKSRKHHAWKRIEREGLILDTAGGSWWVWTARGDVLVMGYETKAGAVRALADLTTTGAP